MYIYLLMETTIFVGKFETDFALTCAFSLPFRNSIANWQLELSV